MRALLFAAIGVATLAVPVVAGADVIETADLTYASGATFDGTITFSNDFSVVTAVDGILTGYQAGNPNYLGSGSTSSTPCSISASTRRRARTSTI